MTIALNKNEIWTRVNNFICYDVELARQSYSLGKDSRDWKVENAQNDIRNSGPSLDCIKKVNYRPFDCRYTYYTGNSRGFYSSPQKAIMRHMLEENIGLTIVRQVKTGNHWQHCLINNQIIESCYVSNRTSEIGYLLPLYLYPKQDSGDWLEQQQTERKPNIAPEIFEQLSSNFGVQPTPEEILYYIYAVFYSNTYRTRYAEFLKIDFPRVPFTSNYELFKEMAELGEKIANLHLLKGDDFDKPVSRYMGSGEDNKIAKPIYNEAEKRVYINADKYFDNVKLEVWEYQIGGYQVLYKYLKDRKGRQMEDPRHYCRVVTALAKTIEYQKKIDEIYDDVEKGIVEF